MCWDCFLQYTGEPVVNERVVAVYRLIANHGDDASYSTLLHIMIGDMNLEDHWFDLTNPENASGKQRYDEATDWERSIFDGLAGLSEAERATAVAMEWGYINPLGELRADLLNAKVTD